MEICDRLKDIYDNISVFMRKPEGQVYKCTHKRTKKDVLLSEITDGARDADFFRRTEIWIDLLDHDGILPIYYVHKIDRSIYLAVELMESDLKRVIAAKILLPVHNQYIIYQILRILKYAHSANVVLKALRSDKFGINSECELRLENFTDAFVGVAEEKLEHGVTNQWYRAPEALIGLNKDLTSAVDMWALGCILGELLSQGQPPFRGTSSNDQMEKILEFVECTEQDLTEMATSVNAGVVMEKRKTIERKDIKELYPNASEDALDLLGRFLQFNPKNRITADEALKHKYLVDFKGGMAEYDCPNKATVPNVDDEEFYNSKEYRKELVQRLMDKFRQKVFDPITTAKILAHNIARSSDALKLLPLEMWTLIFSFIECRFYDSCGAIVTTIFNSYLKGDNRAKYGKVN